MRTIHQTFALLFYVFALITITSCTKNPVTDPISPSLGDTALFTPSASWECKIDGISYSGTIDTSFTQYISNSDAYPDTILTCNGTSYDKKANIQFKLNINRTHRTDSLVKTDFNGLLIFDTTSVNYRKASFNTGSVVTYKVDTLVSNKLKASFSGTLRADNDPTVHSISDGIFSCAFGKGNAEPKAFAFKANTELKAGYISYARIVSNTLIIDGLPYSNFGEERFRLMIRTGGTIKTGRYESRNGDVGLEFYHPSSYPFYVTDSLGDLSLTVDAVAGDIIYGSFSGNDALGDPIKEGKFSCRVKDYVPQIDSANKWQFSEDDALYQYNMYAGNVLGAKMTQERSSYILTIKGESDHGASAFKIALSSYTPITTGVYQTGNTGKMLDSFYLKSAFERTDGRPTHLFVNGNTTSYCSIDTLDARHVVGKIYGEVSIYLSPNSRGTTLIKQGKFTASF